MSGPERSCTTAPGPVPHSAPVQTSLRPLKYQAIISTDPLHTASAALRADFISSCITIIPHYRPGATASSLSNTTGLCAALAVVLVVDPPHSASPAARAKGRSTPLPPLFSAHARPTTVISTSSLAPSAITQLQFTINVVDNRRVITTVAVRIPDQLPSLRNPRNIEFAACVLTRLGFTHQIGVSRSRRDPFDYGRHQSDQHFHTLYRRAGGSRSASTHIDALHYIIVLANHDFCRAQYHHDHVGR